MDLDFSKLDLQMMMLPNMFSRQLLVSQNLLASSLEWTKKTLTLVKTLSKASLKFIIRFKKVLSLSLTTWLKYGIISWVKNSKSLQRSTNSWSQNLLKTQRKTGRRLLNSSLKNITLLNFTFAFKLFCLSMRLAKRQEQSLIVVMESLIQFLSTKATQFHMQFNKFLSLEDIWITGCSSYSILRDIPLNLLKIKTTVMSKRSKRQTALLPKITTQRWKLPRTWTTFQFLTKLEMKPSPSAQNESHALNFCSSQTREAWELMEFINSHLTLLWNVIMTSRKICSKELYWQVEVLCLEAWRTVWRRKFRL